MTLEITQTPMTRAEAVEATERIRSSLDRVSTAWAELSERIADAYQRRADLALGYTSWAAYADAELKPGGELAANVRADLVGLLSRTGMSPRAIAPVVGVTRQRVSQIRAEVQSQGANHLHPGPEVINHRTGEVITELPADADHVPDFEDNEPEPVKTIGLDGKAYTRIPKPDPPKEPTRRPIGGDFATALYELERRADALLKLTEDDRFPRNRAAIKDQNEAQMRRTASTVAAVLAAITN